MMSFGCTGCGACCKRIGQFKEKFEELNFPYDADEKGWCTMLDPVTNKCKVYDNRPDICSVEKTYHMLFEKSGINKKDYYNANAKICNRYIEEDQLDKKYLVNQHE